MRKTGSPAILAVGAVVLAGCNSPSAAPGPDRASGSNATAITWSDGRPAYAIACGVPGGCQERAIALCKGSYSTLSSENMPTPGTVRSVQGPPSVVVRCR
jgi:hypothetical protein